MQMIDVADLGRSGIGSSNALGIRDRRSQLGPNGFRRFEQADGVAHRLRHLRLAIETHDPASWCEQRFRFRKKRFARLRSVLRTFTSKLTKQGVPPPSDDARELQVLNLILSDRHGV